MGDQRFSLKWNNYQSHLVTAFESLLGEGDFVDVTLGVEGRRLSAHKMLLSACSPYFRELLKGNPCQHPIIVLRDIKYDDLHSLLQFMYNGEVNVAQDQLNSFLKSAESLKIRGLTDNAEEATNRREEVKQPDRRATATPPSVLKKKRPQEGASAPPPPKRVPPPIPPQHKDPEPVKQEVIELTEDQDTYDESGAALGYDEGGGTVQQYDERGYEDEGALAVPDGIDPDQDGQGEDGWYVYNTSGRTGYANPQTGYSVVQPAYGDTGYFDDVLITEGVVCKECGKQFRSKDSLVHHMQVHRGLTDCKICGNVQSKVANLKRHLAKVHNVDMDLNPIVDT